MAKRKEMNNKIRQIIYKGNCKHIKQMNEACCKKLINKRMKKTQNKSNKSWNCDREWNLVITMQRNWKKSMKNYNRKSIKWKLSFQIIKKDVQYSSSKNTKNNCKFIEDKLKRKKRHSSE